MHYLLHLLDIFSALFTHFSLGAAYLKMLIELFHRYGITTKLTNLRLVLTALFVLTKLMFHCGVSAELAGYQSMFLLLMIFLVCLCYALAAGGALVVLARTAHIVHTKA